MLVQLGAMPVNSMELVVIIDWKTLTGGDSIIIIDNILVVHTVNSQSDSVARKKTRVRIPFIYNTVSS
jgi:hypothetical protein